MKLDFATGIIFKLMCNTLFEDLVDFSLQKTHFCLNF